MLFLVCKSFQESCLLPCMDRVLLSSRSPLCIPVLSTWVQHCCSVLAARHFNHAHSIHFGSQLHGYRTKCWIRGYFSVQSSHLLFTMVSTLSHCLWMGPAGIIHSYGQGSLSAVQSDSSRYVVVYSGHCILHICQNSTWVDHAKECIFKNPFILQQF